MSNTIDVDIGRTNIVNVSLGIDVSGDILTSEIRTESGILIATWGLVFDGDGTDGELILTLDNTVTAAIVYPNGLMDIKRVTASEPISVFDQLLEVNFRKVITT